MKKGVLNYLNNYLNKLEEAENADIFEIGPERYEDNIQDLIIEIGTVFIKELPEIRESVILRSDTLSRDLNMTKGIIKKYLIENGFKEINKNNQNIEKFWTSFITYFENELPTKGYLKEEYIQYDNWNAGKYLLNIDYNNQYKLHYGVEYKPCSTINEIKMFVELAFAY